MKLKMVKVKISENGTFMVDTGIFTGRSPKDKYFVKQDPSQICRLGRYQQNLSQKSFLTSF